MANPKPPQKRPQTQRLSKEQVARTSAELLAYLPRLATTTDGRIDFAESDPIILALLSESAEVTVKVINRGVAAIGNLMAYASPEIEDGSISADTMEALGWFLAEIGDFSALLMGLTIGCRLGISNDEAPLRRLLNSLLDPAKKMPEK